VSEGGSGTNRHRLRGAVWTGLYQLLKYPVVARSVLMDIDLIARAIMAELSDRSLLNALDDEIIAEIKRR
jgi:hypothetical protein